MGRQINYYMDVDSFKQLAQKALDLEFTIIEQRSIKYDDGLYHGEQTAYHSIVEIDFSIQRARYCFHLEEADPLIVSDNGFIDKLQSPVIEAEYSIIYENMISRSRLWVSTGYYNGAGTFINRSDILDRKYSVLARLVKKLAPYTEIPVKHQNGETSIFKEYITPYLLDLVNKGQCECRAN